MSDFEREIEEELHRALDPTMGVTIPAWRTLSSGSIGRRLLGGAGVALGVKVLTGIAVAAAAATFAGAATETVITGSLSPSVWGQQVQRSVEVCKGKLATNGQHGIGDCVSDFATKHGDTISDNHQSPEAAEKSPGDKKPAHPGTGRNTGHTDGSKQPTGASSTQVVEHRPTPAAPRP